MAARRARLIGSSAIATILLAAIALPPLSAQPHLPEPLPEIACPEGTERHVDHFLDRRNDERLVVGCKGRDEEGFPVRQGPSYRYAVERKDGAVTYRVLEMFEYRDGSFHGLHRRWSGPERLVLEETLAERRPEGARRTWYESGSPREESFFREGQLQGERRTWYPSGEERWRAVYEAGRRVIFEGDRAVAGEPCPEVSLPMASADGLEEFCESRGGTGGVRHGPYVVWAADGSVVERGVYRYGKKAEVWEAPPGAPPRPGELEGVLVAEIWLTAGEMDLSAVAELEPNRWFRDLATGDFVHPDAEYEGSKVKVFGLPPGSYAIFFRIDVDRSSPEYYPGDLGGDVRFDVVEGEVARAELDLDRVLHLIEPFDNSAVIRWIDLPCEEQPVLPSPTRFAWKPPVPSAPDLEYHYRVARVRCGPFRNLGLVAEGSTRGTDVELELPPSRPGESYHFRLHVTSAGETVGFITSHGPRRTQGWHVGFRVGAAD